MMINTPPDEYGMFYHTKSWDFRGNHDQRSHLGYHIFRQILWELKVLRSPVQTCYRQGMSSNVFGAMALANRATMR